MPRLIAFRIGPLWVAAHLNDYGEVHTPRFGFSEQHARTRVCRAG